MGQNAAIAYGDGRGEILDATIALIAESGVNGFAMRQVSSRVAMVVGSITHHFKSRAMLIVTAVGVHVDRVETYVNGLLGDDGAGPDELEQAVLSFYADRHNALLGAELRLAATRAADLRELNDRLLDSETRLITAYQAARGLPQRPELLTEVHACALSTAAQVMADQYPAAFTRGCRRLLRVSA